MTRAIVTRVIRDDAGQLVEVPAWKCAPPRRRASDFTHSRQLLDSAFPGSCLTGRQASPCFLPAIFRIFNQPTKESPNG